MPKTEQTITGPTRREFGLMGTAAITAAALPGQAGKITAAQVIERIQRNVGVPWNPQTRDVFKAGDPGTAVTGIATTVMSTLSILQRAARAGRNLVITHEPTFWSDSDATREIGDDEVFRIKSDFIRKNNMVVWRFHDHWHARKPDAMLVGLAQDLRWTDALDDSKRVYRFGPTTLGELAADMQNRLKFRVIRMIGDPATKVAKGAINVGSTSLQVVMKLLPEVDVFVAGEPREWEGPEYAQDAVAAGQKKGMIIIGHQVSEDPGMRLCAEWVRSFVAEVPVEWIPTADPFSRG